MCFGCVCCPHFLRLCVFVSHLCWPVLRVARWIPVSQRHRRHFSVQQRRPIQCAQPALAVWSPIKGFALHDLGRYGLHAQVRDRERVTKKNQQNVQAVLQMSNSQTLPATAHAVSLQFRLGRGSHLVHTFCDCVCLFPTADGCCPLSQIGFLFQRNIADIVQCNRGVLRNLGGYGLHAEGRDQERVMEKNQKTYGQIRNFRTHSHCWQRHVVSLQICRGRSAHP